MWFCGNGFGTVGIARGKVQTGVRLTVRSNETADGASAAAWRDVDPGCPLDVQRFIQVGAELWSSDRELTPALNRLTIQAHG